MSRAAEEQAPEWGHVEEPVVGNAKGPGESGQNPQHFGLGPLGSGQCPTPRPPKRHVLMAQGPRCLLPSSLWEPGSFWAIVLYSAPHSCSNVLELRRDKFCLDPQFQKGIRL